MLTMKCITAQKVINYLTFQLIPNFLRRKNKICGSNNSFVGMFQLILLLALTKILDQSE